MTTKTILVIDDSATIRKLVDSTLSPLGYIVQLTANAEDGLQRAAEVQPDMILLDHQLATWSKGWKTAPRSLRMKEERIETNKDVHRKQLSVFESCFAI